MKNQCKKKLYIKSIELQLGEQSPNGAVAQWYSQRTSVLEVVGAIPALVIVELL